MVYPENDTVVPFITAAVEQEVALYPAHTVKVQPRFEFNPFLGITGFTHGDAHVIELNSHYICYLPDLNGDNEVSSEATQMALEGAKESRMALAHMDVTQSGGVPGPAYDFFFRLYQNAQDPLLIPRYRPEDLLGYFVFGYKPTEIRTQTTAFCYDPEWDFLLGDALTNVNNFTSQFATYTGKQAGILIANGQEISFMRSFPAALGRNVTDAQRTHQLSFYNGWFKRSLTPAQLTAMQKANWDKRLVNLTYSIYQCPYFWSLLYQHLTT